MLPLVSPHGPPARLAYSRDGSRLAAGYAAGVVEVWDPLAARRVFVLTVDDVVAEVTSLAFDADATLLAVGHRGGVVQVWRADEGRFGWRTRWESGDAGRPLPTLVDFNRDGSRLAAGHEVEVKELSPRTGSPLRSHRLDSYYPARHLASLCYLTDGVLVGGSHNVIQVWKPAARFNEAVNWPDGEVGDLRPSPDGSRLAAFRAKDVGIWDVAEGDTRLSRRPRRSIRHTDPVRAVAWLPEGDRLLTAGDDWSVHVRSAATGEALRSFNFRLGPVRALAVAPDGMTAAVAGRDGGAVVFDLE